MRDHPNAPTVMSGRGVAVVGGEVLHRSERFLVTRQPVGDDDGAMVIFKQPLGFEAGARLRHERQILERLATVPRVPRLVAVPCPTGALALSSIPGVTLLERLRAGPPPVREQVTIALRLARILAAVHLAGVTHGDITASNVLLDAESGEPALIDFSRATTVAESQPGFTHHNEIEGALATLAPEQTGRTGRAVDQRSDLYSLGATLYQMVTGSPPFEAADPLRLLRDVLTRTPVPPAVRDPRVPVGFSAIIMRLLEKEPDQRYQSAEGLAHDLVRLDSRVERGEFGPFHLGEHDFPLRLSAPGRLVGRHREIAALERALEDAVRGECRAVLVSGAPGVGKTVLIDELRPRVTARGGWFVAGKYDQNRRDQAADGVLQALRALGRLLLTESDADFARQRARLLAALGGNAGVLASVQPELALVLDVKPEPLREDSGREHGRLLRATIDVLRAVSGPDHPVVVFLDDLQWAEEASVSVLDALLGDEDLPGLLVVGAYRPGEVDVAHPLSARIARWQRLPMPPVTLEPKNLPTADLGVMLCEMLRLPESSALALAEVIGARTAGNPFDTVALVNALRKDGALVRDVDGWRWDAATIRRHVGEGDVVELLARRVDRLPQPTRALLDRIACLGGEVETDLLGTVVEATQSCLEERLAPALEDGLLVQGQANRSSPSVVRFRHDRVQQAALSRLGPGAPRALRLDLGRRLAVLPEYRGLAADQYLTVTGDVVDEEERWLVIGLFYAAAKALRLLNPTMAERFLASAIALFDEIGGASGPELTSVAEPGEAGVSEARRRRLALETAHHAALYHLGRLSDADERYRSIEALKPSALELVDAACVQVSSLTFRERPGESVALGLDLLARLGVKVPTDEQIEERIEEGFARFHQWVAEDRLADDLAKNDATDPAGMGTARLISRMIPSAYFVAMPIWPWLVLEGQRLWVEHGPCPDLVGPLSHASFLSITIRQDFRTGYAAIRRVLAVCEAHGHEPETAHAYLLFVLSSAQWFEPLETVVAAAERAFESLVRVGDQQNAGFAAYALVPTSLECAPNLGVFLTQVDACLAFAERTSNTQTKASMLGYRQLARALAGKTSGPGALTDATFDANAHLTEQLDNPVATSYARMSYSIAAAIAGDERALDEHTAEAMALEPYFNATLSVAVLYLLRALALAGRLRADAATGSASDIRAATLRELDRCREFLARRAADAPVNFVHLLHLVDAERAWVVGDFRVAAAAYDASLSAVRATQRPWHAALAAERAARFHLTNGLEYTGRFLLAEARDLYQTWGAAGKVKDLERANPFLRAGAARHRASDTIGGGSGQSVSSEEIDLTAMFGACQALSSETSLARLHARVREVLSAVTGATSVRVVLWRDAPTGWFLPDPSGAVSPGTPLTGDGGHELVPLSAFRYAERTRQPLLVPDVARDDRFAADPYFQGRRCRSMLIMPILSHGAPRAMLILEHQVSRAAFTEDRLDAVRVLAGQLAVSLENAIVYEELEERVRSRTQELRDIQSELIATARRAGMAEIATNVLHNVGNVLTSVNVSANLVVNRTRASKVDGLNRAVDLLREHETDLGEFLTTDERGRLLPGYLAKVASALETEHRDVVAELGQLSKNIEHIMDIVETQQTYAGAASVNEPTDVAELIGDAIRVNAEALTRHHVTVTFHRPRFQMVSVDRARLVLILVNLISNAKNALARVDDRKRVVTIDAEIVTDGRLRITVADNGDGIRREHLTQIFAHGFTTREGGHGFGLHSCALAAGEMGGTLSAASEGEGRGAAFALELPVTIKGAC